MQNQLRDYSLDLYENVLQGTNYVATLTQAHNWKRSIRRIGGYWDGSFELRDDYSVLLDFFYTQLGAHLEEKSYGNVTWEGFIGDIDTPEEDKDGWFMKVYPFGYVHTLSFRHVSVSDDTTGNVSTWIGDILDADCEYIASKAIDTNTLQVLRSNSKDPRAWDEIKRVTELGDGSGIPWRFYVDNGRRAVYTQNDTSVLYYIRGGVRRRRSMFAMWNHVGGSYIDDDNNVNPITPATNAESARRYGRREQKIYRDGLPESAMEALRDSYLTENAYPWPRPLGTAGTSKLYDSLNSQVELSQWIIRPGVVRDMLYTAGSQEYDGWLEDQRDVMVDEVVASEKGISLRTDEFSEAELLEAQYMYANETNELDFDLSD